MYTRKLFYNQGLIPKIYVFIYFVMNFYLYIGGVIFVFVFWLVTEFNFTFCDLDLL